MNNFFNFNEQDSENSEPNKDFISSWRKLQSKAKKIDIRNETLIPLNERLSTKFLSYGTLNEFECNQSFPKIKQNNNRVKGEKSDEHQFILNVVTPTRQYQKNASQKMDKIKLDKFNGLRFTPYRKKGCFQPNSIAPYNCSLFNAKCGINPNKAVFTIDSKTSSILIVNKNACNLLGFSSRELCDSNMKFSNLLACKNKVHVSALAENQFNPEEGVLFLLSGKVVEMIHKNGDKIPVSLWIRHIDGHDGRCLAVAEAVERKVSQLIIDSNGIVMHGDNEALMLFQLDSLDKFIGIDITVLIPAIQLPDNDCVISKVVRKQRATGRTQDGVSFPLCLMVTNHDNEDDECSDGVRFAVTIWVYTNLSGLIVIDDNSIIESCNHHFSTIMFGYSQSKIIGQNIFKLIPNFGQEFEYIDARSQISPSIDNEESETETDHILDPFSMALAPPTSIVSSSSLLNNNKSSKDTFKICLDFTSSSHSSLRSDIDKIESENDKNIANYSTDDDTNNELLTPVNEDPSDQMQHSIDETHTPNNSNKNTITHTPISSSNMIETHAPKVSSNTNKLPNDNCLQSTKTTNATIIPATSTPDIQRKRSSIGASLESNYFRFQSPSSSSHNPCSIQTFNYNYVDGKYKGEAVHSDGNIIDIVYTIYKHYLTASNSTIYLIWISRDPDSECLHKDDECDEEKQFNLTLTLNSFTSTLDNSVGGAIKNTNNTTSACISSNATSMMTSATAGTNTLANITSSQASRPNSLSILSQCEEEQISGEYSKNYTTLKQIGKGAYGFVKMAFRNSDKLLVISKFILKEKLCPNFMITTEDKKEIPMEIYLLLRVKHANIVSVLDVYENEKFFQLIMEKHGSGMDLFEFIDRRPLMDEKLGCYIFRQIANAVDYLHSLNILHRDIKDENIIIDHHFQIKLIDFGSATFMQEGKMFSTFYGTTEYCSPEVLAGNKYQGPELEMWSLGVTLFVLIFFENPFLDLEDTLRAELLFPQDVSVALESVLLKMLDKDPKTRMTMKELLTNEWITQEIINNFNFALIVPCTENESNPEIYFDSGHAVYSSATALSTSHDSLSLVDDSIVDACDDSDLKSSDFDDQLVLMKINQNLNELHLSKDELSSSVSTNNRNASCNRSKTGNKNIYKVTTTQQMDVSDCAHTETAQVKFEHPKIVDVGLLVSPPNENYIRKISNSSSSDKNSTLNVHSLHANVSSITISISPSITNATTNNNNTLTTSKSENNIFDRNISMNASVFNVVSLSDLCEDASQYTNSNNGTYHMNDLSRTQVLNRLSDERVDNEDASCEANDEILWENHYYSRIDAFEDN